MSKEDRYELPPQCIPLQEVRDKLRGKFEQAGRKREAYELDSVQEICLSERMWAYSCAMDMLNDAIHDLKMQARQSSR